MTTLAFNELSTFTRLKFGSCFVSANFKQVHSADTSSTLAVSVIKSTFFVETIVFK